MTAEKIVYIIPGFKQRTSGKAYKEIAAILKSEGYHPILITIPWKKTSISENTAYFLKEYKKVLAKKEYILGFSFGAMIAFLAATKVNTTGLILCSLSPYFQEDLEKMKKNPAAQITRRRYKDFSKLHCSSLAKRVKAGQIHMLYGAKEAKTLIKRVTETYGHLSSTDKYLIPIEKTTHDIGDKRYLTKIHQIAKIMN
ncbi:MAG: hypothetical protein HY430_00920 [Candidatus Levybacteria bacterium]|nr:hypothetical protein [Candidatus Levybacteria bacterium]